MGLGLIDAAGEAAVFPNPTPSAKHSLKRVTRIAEIPTAN